jgi:hypothetical protein
MLASTVQFSTNDQPTTPPKTPAPPETEATGMSPRLRLAPKKPTTPERLLSGAHPHRGGPARRHPLRGAGHGCFLRTQQGAFTPPPAAPAARSPETHGPAY